MKKTRLYLLIPIALVLLTVYACSKSDGSESEADSGNGEFKKGMLINYADNIVIPAYVDLQTKLATLETDVNTFLNDPSVSNQTNAKASFKNAYLAFEQVSVANFGPAASTSILLNNFLNSFPADLLKIETSISSGSYNFNLQVSSDSIQGFPTLDYLLFSNDAVTKFANGNAGNRKKYVQDVITRMKLLVDNTVSSWKGSFRETFINSLKTDIGSSIGNLVNQFAFEMDALKGPRIGWPFGKQSDGIVFADKCEGYYSGISKDLAVANLTSLKNYYTGGSGDGIADYLILLKNDQLNTKVLDQFELALTALKAIPDPLSASFVNNKPLIEDAYKQVQKLLTLIKTDVASATSVRISYQDTDGD